MREPPGPCGAGRLRCVWLCGAWPLCVPAGGGPPRGLFCWAGPLCVPVGGGPPARSPHASLAARSGRSRSPARPRHRPPAPRPGPASLRRSRGGLPSVGLVVRELPALALRALLRPPHRRLRCCVWWPSSRCPAGRMAAFHRSGIIVVSGLVLPPPINFACNSPPLSCRFVSVCSVVSLVFLNCMRLLLNAAPDSARRYRGGSFWTLSALPIDQTGCVCG